MRLMAHNSVKRINLKKKKKKAGLVLPATVAP